MDYLTVSPAYGRDYTSAKAALAAWDEGRDFIAHSMWASGTYISKADLKAMPPTRITIRYDEMRKLVNVP